MPRAPDETVFDLFLTTRANVIYTRRQHRGTNTYFAARECVCLACCELDEEVLPLKVAGVGYNGVAAPQGSEYGLVVGDRVVVHGMKRDVTLNGMSGSVQGVQVRAPRTGTLLIMQSVPPGGIAPTAADAAVPRAPFRVVVDRRCRRRRARRTPLWWCAWTQSKAVPRR